ncbi:MAG: hypothetical protein WBD20_28445, partial [Pirellulaceae bacterium]
VDCGPSGSIGLNRLPFPLLSFVPQKDVLKRPSINGEASCDPSAGTKRAAQHSLTLMESLEREYGVDYETWLQETRIESARGTTKHQSATQFTFPELHFRRDFLVESL